MEAVGQMGKKARIGRTARGEACRRIDPVNCLWTERERRPEGTSPGSVGRNAQDGRGTLERDRPMGTKARRGCRHAAGMNKGGAGRGMQVWHALACECSAQEAMARIGRVAEQWCGVARRGGKCRRAALAAAAAAGTRARTSA